MSEVQSETSHEEPDAPEAVVTAAAENGHPKPAPTRAKSHRFSAHRARLVRVPLRIGLFGPTGAGKTYSALRLATGIRAVTGGDIIVLDTENARACHYADEFDFLHVDFSPPHGSADYAAALRTCAARDPAVIIIDSLSHEHDGKDGFLDAADQEIERLSGSDPALIARVQSLAWRRPRANRRAWLAALHHTKAHVICCFRASERVRAQRDPSDMSAEPVFAPITGTEVLYDMTCTALLPADSEGRAVWSRNPSGGVKRPGFLAEMLRDDAVLDETAGRAIASWAEGGVTHKKRRRSRPVREPVRRPASTPAGKPASKPGSARKVAGSVTSPAAKRAANGAA